MTKDVEGKIDTLMSDPNLGEDEKVAKLKKMYLDIRALQRAATEGGMAPPSDDAETDEGLRAVEKALEDLGVDPTEIEDSAATL